MISLITKLITVLKILKFRIKTKNIQNNLMIYLRLKEMTKRKKMIINKNLKNKYCNNKNYKNKNNKNKNNKNKKKINQEISQNKINKPKILFFHN